MWINVVANNAFVRSVIVIVIVTSRLMNGKKIHSNLVLSREIEIEITRKQKQKQET
jgi:hypothetical protein